jgi:hypothetical protein
MMGAVDPGSTMTIYGDLCRAAHRPWPSLSVRSFRPHFQSLSDLKSPLGLGAQEKVGHTCGKPQPWLEHNDRWWTVLELQHIEMSALQP